MTNEEKAEEYVKNEVCIKLCPTWKAHNGNCDLFPKCHYVSSKIKFYRLGLAEGRKEQKNKDNCIDCEYVNLIIDKDNQIFKLEKENKISEEIIIGEQQEINRLEKENKSLGERVLQLEKDVEFWKNEYYYLKANPEEV